MTLAVYQNGEYGTDPALTTMIFTNWDYFCDKGICFVNLTFYGNFFIGWSLR